MKKESIIAISLGILFGISIAVFIIFFSGDNTQDKVLTNPTISPAIKISPHQEEPFIIEKPTDKSIENSSEVTITGKAPKNSLIVIQSPYSEKTVQTTAPTFSIDFPLTAGENVISIVSYYKTTVEEKKLSVYYIDL